MRAAPLGLLAAVLAAGCGGSGDEPLFSPRAREAADAFVRELVADGDPVAASGFAAGTAAQNLDLWSEFFKRDGIQTVEGPGGERANCLKPFPVFVPRSEGSCIVYRLRGLRPIANSRRTLVTTARLRVWLVRYHDAWRVADFDYSPRLEAR